MGTAHDAAATQTGGRMSGCQGRWGGRPARLAVAEIDHGTACAAAVWRCATVPAATPSR